MVLINSTKLRINKNTFYWKRIYIFQCWLKMRLMAKNSAILIYLMIFFLKRYIMKRFWVVKIAFGRQKGGLQINTNSRKKKRDFTKKYLQDLLENLTTDQIKLPKSGNQIINTRINCSVWIWSIFFLCQLIFKSWVRPSFDNHFKSVSTICIITITTVFCVFAHFVFKLL